ncbi:hypothetical protein MCL26_08600 [Acinetobacter pittii]|uniref:hypothetical protein n=1 Tax=Acinetobacter pittii TaxID=48296 RepID=UPI001EFD5991|nr:hypothetical protein [Acinetobacter pittii]MCG9515167.1 hypothetical protein [Acinetobacter pittii]
MTCLNFLEIVKLLSPFLIAIIVYKVWHNQKGKEVVANLSQSSIMDLLEEISQIMLVTEKIPKTQSILEEDLTKFILLTQKSLRSILFVSACSNDETLQKTVDEYNSVCGRINIFLDNLERPINLSEFEHSEFCNDLKNEFVKKAEKLIHELMPYAVFKK